MSQPTAEFEIPPLTLDGPTFDRVDAGTLKFVPTGRPPKTPAWVFEVGSLKPGEALVMPLEPDMHNQRNRVQGALIAVYGRGRYSIRKTTGRRLVVVLKQQA